ncbi:hypothetical protein PYCCODRAFT_1469119 [Trametes coccinea BRFM310]|uniref:C2H2-type domain-containing protein n=1 Tax=Trametes coccinea (strain BRFM310) TaxID=1353009 RepID=A0A1Y2ILW5_TRAC3|nr:hypothetical protein PYCCODRAFT_1469119 [Trametes coccinea BRFM310]
MSEKDKPVSFIARGVMARRVSPDASDHDTQRGAVRPRGLPPPRYKDPPKRMYYYTPPLYTEADFHPSQIFDMGPGELWAITEIQTVKLNAQPGLREPRQRRPLPEPLPGLTKSARGRHVPTAGNSTDPRRKHICPVESCRKAFTKRDHVARHIKTLHRHENYTECNMPFCNYSSARRDNHQIHINRHTHYQEIMACTPDNDFKGIHLLNPQVVHPFSADIKPYKAISIPPLALGLWVFQERQRREEGLDIPRSEESDVERYFRAHPDEVESLLRGDPEWEWKMPPAGPEFTPIDGRSMVGSFKLEIKSDPFRHHTA